MRLALLRACVLLTCGPAIAQQIQWIQSPINGHWYGVLQADGTWCGQQQLAHGVGAELATIRSQAEQDWFAGWVPGGIDLVSIGASDEAVEGLWAWANGEPYTLVPNNAQGWDPWAVGEPNNGPVPGQGLEHHAVLERMNGWKWNDACGCACGGNSMLWGLVERVIPPATGWSWHASYPVPVNAHFHAVADVDNDGLLDVIVPSRIGGKVTVFHNLGGGQFSNVQTFDSGPGAFAVAASDFDHDGHVDVAVARYDAQDLAIHSGTANSGFAIGPVYALGGAPHGIASADLNGDGWSDVVLTIVTPPERLTVLLNNQAGGFLPAQSYPTQTLPWFVSASDLDGDKGLDLVVANGGSDSIGVYLNTGGGALAAPSYFGTNMPAPTHPAIADFNRDGKLDLAVASHNVGQVKLWTGDGTGVFALHSTTPLPERSRWVDAADVDGDGLLDLVAGHVASSAVSVLLATQPGNFGAPVALSGSTDTAAVILADLDGDSMPDITCAGPGSNDLVVIMNQHSCSAIASYCTPSTTSHGCPPSMSGVGTPSASLPSGFDITVNNVEGQKMGLIFYGLSPTAVAWAINSTSYVCVAPPVRRTPAHGSGGTAGGCNGVLSVDFNEFMASNPSSLGSPFSAGQVFYAQGWFRDAGAVKGTNLSNGLRFRLCP